MKTIHVVKGMHAEVLKNQASSLYDEVERGTSELSRIYGEDVVIEKVKRLVENPDEIGFGFEASLHKKALDIADMTYAAMLLERYAAAMARIYGEIIRKLRPQKIYIEGRSGKRMPQIEEAYEAVGAHVVFLDRDSKEFRDLKEATTNKYRPTSYSLDQVRREEDWVEEIVNDPPIDGVNLMLIGQHVRRDDEKFGNLAELLEEKEIKLIPLNVPLIEKMHESLYRDLEKRERLRNTRANLLVDRAF